MIEAEFITKTTIKINGEKHVLEILAFDKDGVKQLKLDDKIFSTDDTEYNQEEVNDINSYEINNKHEQNKYKGKALFPTYEKLEYTGAITIYKPVVRYLFSNLKKQFIKEDATALLVRFWDEKLGRKIGGGGVAYAGQYLNYFLAHDLISQDSLGIFTKTDRDFETVLAIPNKLPSAQDLNEVSNYLIEWCERRNAGIINIKNVIEFPLHTSKKATLLTPDELFAGCKLLETAGVVKQINETEFLILKKEDKKESKVIDGKKTREKIKYRRNDTRIRDEQGRKKCSLCKQWLPESDFYSSLQTNDKLKTECWKCSDSWRQEKIKKQNEDRKKELADKGLTIKENSQITEEITKKQTTKICSHCKKTKPLSDFDKGTGAFDLHNTCKNCEHDRYTKKKEDAIKKIFPEKESDVKQEEIPQDKNDTTVLEIDNSMKIKPSTEILLRWIAAYGKPRQCVSIDDIIKNQMKDHELTEEQIFEGFVELIKMKRVYQSGRKEIRLP